MVNPTDTKANAAASEATIQLRKATGRVKEGMEHGSASKRTLVPTKGRRAYCKKGGPE